MSIFDRLTDSSQYTGTHKHRFDETGKGRGKAGRTDEVVLDGYVNAFKKSKETGQNKELGKVSTMTVVY